MAQLPDYHVRLFDDNSGIRTVGLRRITRDRNGFIWLLYHNQVKRFDGKRITVFFPGERLGSILCDRQNRIWVTGIKGLYLFNNDQADFRNVAVDTVWRPSPGNIFELPGQPVQLLTTRGIYTYDSLTGSFRPPAGAFPGAPPFHTRQYSLSTFGNTVFYCAAGNLYRKKPGYCDSLPVSDLYSVNALSEQAALVSNWKNQSFLYDFSAQKISPVNIWQHLPDAADNFLLINDVQPLDASRHLLATSKGLLEYNGVTGKYRACRLFHNGRPLFNQEGLVDLYLDEHRQVWACNDFSLLSFRPGQQEIGLIRNWEPDPARYFSNHVRGFAVDENGNLWLATINGIAYFDLQRGTIRPVFPTSGASDKMNHPSVRGIAYDGRYVIIGQTNRGVWLYEPSTGRYKRPSFSAGPAGDNLRSKLENDFIDQIFTLHNGHHLIAARDGGYLMNGRDYTITPVRFPGEKENLNFCYEDDLHQIWIGTEKSVYCLDSALTLRAALSTRLPGPARCLYQLSGHEYILGTKGLYLLTQKGRQLTLKKLSPHFDRVFIHSVWKDSTDRLWLATDDGLYRYNRLSGKTDFFDQFDNIQGNHFYQNSLYYSRGGVLFLGGFNGINYFRPEAVRAADDSLQVTVTGVRINNEHVAHDSRQGTVWLPYDQNSIDIDFVAPYFSNTGRVQYRYRLAGLDGQWVAHGNNNSVRFSSLPPGAYTFAVAASTSGEKWFEAARPFSFIIRPPFWNTWWFFMIAAAVSTFLLFRLVRRLQEKIRSEKVLNYFATSLYGQNTAEDILWDIAGNCISQLQLEDCVIYEYDEQRGLLVQKAAYGPKNPMKREIINPLEIPLGKGIVGAVARSRRAEIVNNTAKDKRYILDDRQRLSEIAVPILADGKLYGVIDSEHPQRNFYTKRHLQLLTKIAGICAAKISKYMVEEKLRSSIARDLHDEIGSTLTSIDIISKLAMQQMPAHDAAQSHLLRIREHSSRMMESMSDIVWAINPANDTIERIMIRLKEFTAEMLEPARIRYIFNEDGQLDNIRLNPGQRKDIYLIYKEAINNIVKYSEATGVHITLRRERDTMHMVIADDGRGFDVSGTGSGNGIRNMHNRAAALNGTLVIRSIQGGGTTIALQWPV